MGNAGSSDKKEKKDDAKKEEPAADGGGEGGLQGHVLRQGLWAKYSTGKRLTVKSLI